MCPRAFSSFATSKTQFLASGIFWARRGLLNVYVASLEAAADSCRRPDSYDEVKDVKSPCNSAAIVNADGTPAFTVEIDGKPTTLTAHECAVRYLRVLLSYATDFLGRPITTAVMATPADFTSKQAQALTAAAAEAGIKVVQTIDESAAVLAAYAQTLLTDEDVSPAIDRNSVVLDVGATSTNVTIVAVRDGLFVPLAHVVDNKLGGDQFDAKLMDWFSKEFTKKTKVPLEASNHRALMKLRLAVEVTKKSLSASNSAPCSVESLAEGMDFHGSINRMRFDLLASSVYAGIVSQVEKALQKANLDPLQIQEVVLVGGTARLPTLADKLLGLFDADQTNIQSRLDPDEVIARGTALQAQSLLSSETQATVEKALASETALKPSTLSAPIGLVVDDAFHVLLEAHTPLPTRRIIDFASPAAGKLLISLSEGEQTIKVEAPPPKVAKKSGGVAGFFSRSKPEDDDDEDDDEEPEDIRTVESKATKALAEVVVDDVKKGAKKLRLTIVVVEGGKGEVTVEVDGDKVGETTF